MQLDSRIVCGHPEKIENFSLKYLPDSSIDYVIVVPKNYKNHQNLDLKSFVQYSVDHLAIVIGESADICFEQILNDLWQIPRITILLKPYSHLTYTLQGNATQFNGSYLILQEDHSTSEFVFSLMDTQQVSLECIIKLLGQRAEAVIKGCHYNQKDQKVFLKTEQYHCAPHTTSSVFIKGCVTDSAQAHYQGTVHILEEAIGSDAQQFSKHLLLSSQASAVAIPNLEIKTNEVQCKHGSAIGYFDMTQLFYFQARGFSPQKCEDILKEAFLINGH